MLRLVNPELSNYKFLAASPESREIYQFEVDIIQFLPQMIVGGTIPLSLTSASFLTDTFDEILGGKHGCGSMMSVQIFVPKEVVIVLKKAMFELQTFLKSAFCMGTFISKHLNETTAPFGPPPKIYQELRTKTISRISSGVDVVKVGF